MSNSAHTERLSSKCGVCKREQDAIIEECFAYDEQRRKITRGELHVYNIRHVNVAASHGTTQRQVLEAQFDRPCRDPEALPWIGTAWK